ncbi:MAG: helix-turn-helix domain-containing protein [Leptospiraceae bacterium]|nr:helix-turn-helix domain-containing protein [Leptospiraceae bacterium]MDW7975025.1 helix-turn-helix domain-containing protein [Leptospiraceae bacterium]
MASIGKLGDKLRKAREAKGYTLRDVNAHIFVSPKFIEALEKEDYSVFPSETYVLGFLRNYSEFLGLNPDEIINEYKNLRVQTNDTPIKELTQITKPSFFENSSLILKIAIFISAMVLLVLLVYHFIDFFQENSKIFETTSKQIPCDQRELRTVELVADKPYFSNVDFEYNYQINVAGLDKISLCLNQIQLDKENKNVWFEVQYKNQKYNLQGNEGETIVLSNLIPEIQQNQNQIEITVKEILDEVVQVELTAQSKEFVTQKAIVVVLEIIQDTYMEWVSDGKNFRGMFLKQGDLRILEADTRLDIKIGNGAGVRYRRDDLPQKIAGPPGKIVKLSFVKIQDPIDPTKYKIDEKVEIAQ